MLELERESNVKNLNESETALYRYYGDDETLLYVGIAVNPLARLCGHRIGSLWFKKAKRIDIQWFENRKDALFAEKNAIKRENPKYNISHNRGGGEKTSPSKYAKGDEVIATVDIQTFCVPKSGFTHMGFYKTAAKCGDVLIIEDVECNGLFLVKKKGRRRVEKVYFRVFYNQIEGVI